MPHHFTKNFDHQSGDRIEREGARIYFEIVADEEEPPLLLGGFRTIKILIRCFPHSLGNFTSSESTAVDTEGPRSARAHSAMSNCNATRRALAHLGIDRLNMIGFSDGGIAAYRLATFSSLQIEKLVTIGSRWHFKNTEFVRQLLAGVTAESWKTKFPESYAAWQRLNPARS